MKILFVTTRFPLPDHTGGRRRVLHQIRHLARDHAVHLLCLHGEAVSEAERKAIGAASVRVVHHGRAAMARGVLTGLHKGLPLQTMLFRSAALRREVQEIVERYQIDVVVSQMARLDISVAGPAHVVDFVDALSLGLTRRASASSPLLRPALLGEAALMRRYERRVGRQASRRVVTSPVDAKHLEGLGAGPVDVIPVGVSDDFFSPSEDARPTIDVIFTGNLGYAPNIDAASYLVNEVVPLLIEIRPDLKVALVGARPTRAVQSLASSVVDVVGPVEDLRAWLGKARVAVAPMQMGSGVQFKILEAMAMGLPTVTTSLAAGPVGAIADQDLLVADDAIATAGAISSLLSDEQRAAQLGAAGRRFVEGRFRWQQLNEQFEAVLTEAVRG